MGTYGDCPNGIPRKLETTPLVVPMKVPLSRVTCGLDERGKFKGVVFADDEYKELAMMMVQRIWRDPWTAISERAEECAPGDVHARGESTS